MKTYEAKFQQFIDETIKDNDPKRLFVTCQDFTREMPEEVTATFIYWLLKREQERHVKTFAE